LDDVVGVQLSIISSKFNMLQKLLATTKQGGSASYSPPYHTHTQTPLPLPTLAIHAIKMRPVPRVRTLNRTISAVLAQPIGQTFVFRLTELEVPARGVLLLAVAACVV
jgi:hypothetical protein